MFRGTKKYGPEEFSNIIQENGGEDNAFTDCRLHRLLRDDQPRPSRRADRAWKPTGWRISTPKGFDSEKAVVMEERRMRTDDNPEDALAEMPFRRRPSSSIPITGR